MVIDWEYLLKAYKSGYFPMAEPGSGDIYWYSPDPRAIFDLDNFHVPKSLAKKLRTNPFRFKIDGCFKEVMLKCSERDETWISDGIVDSYVKLHELGYAHSFETYYNGELAGGLYGVSINGAFFGESMFHTVRDASKAALVFLVESLKKSHYTLLDTQYITEHLQKFGAIEIPKKEYLKRLNKSLEIETLPFDINE